MDLRGRTEPPRHRHVRRLTQAQSGASAVVIYRNYNIKTIIHIFVVPKPCQRQNELLS